MTYDWPTPEQEIAAAERAAQDLAARKREGMAAAVAWNRNHPIGTWVRFWPGDSADEPRTGRTRSEAWVLSSGHPVVSVQGAACIALTHIEVVES